MPPVVRFETEVRHDGLHKYRHITGSDRHVVEQKARAQLATWDQQWERKLATEERAKRKTAELQTRKENMAKAAQLTADAQAALSNARQILAATLSVDDAVNWDDLKGNSSFPERKPEEPKCRIFRFRQPELASSYEPKFGVLDLLIPALRRKKIAAARSRYQADLAKWNKCRSQFEQRQAAKNNAIDAQRKRYEDGDPSAIEEYCDLVLMRSNYPDWCPQEFQCAYEPEGRTAVIDYVLPSPDALPKIKDVKYIQTHDEFRESTVSKNEQKKIYDSAIYQICIRTIHEIFESDVESFIESVVFNGWVNFIDPATGKNARSCIVSLQTTRSEFLEVNLAAIDPKTCFRSLKGVGSSQLHSLAAVAPIMQINRDDDRFVQSLAIADGLDAGVNLAAMDWEDFEHLVRELFEYEFAANGGEVNVTRASRDRGVDAIAFDPDPIRGGKIVIQAKRYTNTVGVEAVRDLYGTVVNEGAIKGILATTATFGPDAYEFARDKPLTLLSGSNLLHMLKKHGRNARIDLAEAKLMAKSAEA